MVVQLGIPEIIAFVTAILGAIGTVVGILFRSLIESKHAEIRAAYREAEQMRTERDLYRDALFNAAIPTMRSAATTVEKAATMALGKAV